MALTDNLIVYYKLDEGSGNAADSHSVGPYDLTQNGTVGTRAGKINSARDFDGNNADYLSHADNADLSTGDIDWSVFLWVIIDSNLGSFPQIATKGFQEGGTDREWELYVDPTNGFAFQNRNELDGTPQVTQGATISTGTWYFVAFGNSSTNNETWISVNGGTPVTTSVMFGTNDGAGSLRLGTCPAVGTAPLDGGIDEFAFFKRDIRSDLASFYASGAGLAYPFSAGGSPVLNDLMHQPGFQPVLCM